MTNDKEADWLIMIFKSSSVANFFISLSLITSDSGTIGGTRVTFSPESTKQLLPDCHHIDQGTVVFRRTPSKCLCVSQTYLSQICIVYSTVCNRSLVNF